MEKEKIKKTIEEILKLMSLDIEDVSVVENAWGGATKFLIRSRDSRFIIGSRGATLSALNHLVKRIAEKDKSETAEPEQFFIDVNDYQEKLLEELKTKAKIMGERARSFKVDIEMEPMSSYERMLIHTFLGESPDIKTESKGEGQNRRIIIKYVPSTPEEDLKTL